MIYKLMAGAFFGSVIGSLAASAITGGNPWPSIIIGAAVGFTLSLSLANYRQAEK